MPEQEPPTSRPPYEPTYEPPVSVPYGPSVPAGSIAAAQLEASDSRTGRRVLVTVLVTVLALAVLVPAVVGVVVAVRSYDDGAAPAVPEREPVMLHTETGYGELVDAMSEVTGETEAFDLVLYPTYAVVSVPAEATGGRYHSYFYDGALRRTGQGTSTERRFDLAGLDSSEMVRLLTRARTDLVEEPTQVYLIVRRPADPDEGWYWAYAHNEYTESGYLQADRRGRVLYRYVSTE